MKKNMLIVFCLVSCLAYASDGTVTNVNKSTGTYQVGCSKCEVTRTKIPETSKGTNGISENLSTRKNKGKFNNG